MHTFFINTSKKDVTGYDVLFDVHYERKNLVTLDCLLSDWYDKEKGYSACVRRMSEMIDGYVELNNAFNLIIYIDLPENKAYSEIARDAYHDREREACCCAMHTLFTHVMRESIVEELVDSGRRPQNVLLMFGEEKQFTDFQAAENEASRNAVMQKLFGFLGLPEETVTVELAKNYLDGDTEQLLPEFQEKLFSACGGEIISGIRRHYAGELHLWMEDILHSANMEQANAALFDHIQKTYHAETERIGIESLSCPYDCYACKVNKSILALSQLNIALHLLACVEAQTIYAAKDDAKERTLIPFRCYKMKDLVHLFREKKAVYAAKVDEVEHLSKSYPELELAERLRAFDHERFGLDQYGDVAVELTVSDAADTPAQEGENATAIVRGEKELTMVEKSGRVLFTREEFMPFDYTYSEADDAIRKKATPEEYIEQAKKKRMHHLDFLKKLKVHVSDVLSNYAGKSKANKPALLKVGSYRYARYGKEDSAVYDDQVLETAENMANKAFVSIMDQYMEFCAGRSVAITDIEEQCNWFVSRVYQIRESLNRIRAVGIGLLGGLLALYIPFLVTQFSQIVQDVTTVTVALGSLLLPILLMYGVFTVVAVAQKRKYREAWEEFKEKSKEALEENQLAAEKYDQLLSIIIPALRWVYEYQLDVRYCLECCAVADAKIEHHRRKLRTRVTAITNILGDLEYRDSGEEEAIQLPEPDPKAIDYNVPFCAGKKNSAFYSVVDHRFFSGMNQ